MDKYANWDCFDIQNKKNKNEKKNLIKANKNHQIGWIDKPIDERTKKYEQSININSILRNLYKTLQHSYFLFLPSACWIFSFDSASLLTDSERI